MMLFDDRLMSRNRRAEAAEQRVNASASTTQRSNPGMAISVPAGPDEKDGKDEAITRMLCASTTRLRITTRIAQRRRRAVRTERITASASVNVVQASLVIERKKSPEYQ